MPHGWLQFVRTYLVEATIMGLVNRQQGDDRTEINALASQFKSPCPICKRSSRGASVLWYGALRVPVTLRGMRLAENWRINWGYKCAWTGLHELRTAVGSGSRWLIALDDEALCPQS